MGMTEGEGVLEEDMGLGTEGDLCIRFIPLQLLCDLYEQQLGHVNFSNLLKVKL